MQILRDDTLGATCSAGPFCLLPKDTVRVVSQRVVLADAPGPPKPERGHKRQNDGTKTRNEGTKKRNDGAKTGTRVHSKR